MTHPALSDWYLKPDRSGATPLSEFDLTSEEEEQLINNIAKIVVDNGLEAPAIMFLEVTKPLSFIASQFAILALGPLQWLFELEGPKYTGLFMKRESVGKIIDRIEDLAKKKD